MTLQVSMRIEAARKWCDMYKTVVFSSNFAAALVEIVFNHSDYLAEHDPQTLKNAQKIIANYHGNTAYTWEDFMPKNDALQDAWIALKAVLPYAERELESLDECQRRDGGLEDEVAECAAAVENAQRVLGIEGKA